MGRSAEHSSLEQRLDILHRAQAGEDDPTIARSIGLSRWTVRKWRRLGTRGGREALTQRLGRPPTGALTQVALPLRDEIRRLRIAHPGWGPVTLRLEIRKQRWR